jgi:hypothetical protein
VVWGYTDHFFDSFRRHPIPLPLLTFLGEYDNQALATKLEEVLVRRDDVREVRTNRAGKIQRQISRIMNVRDSEFNETWEDTLNALWRTNQIRFPTHKYKTGIDSKRVSQSEKISEKAKNECTILPPEGQQWGTEKRLVGLVRYVCCVNQELLAGCYH